MTDKQENSKIATRRKFLLAAGATGAAAVVAPNVVKAQGAQSMRFQSTWPSKDIFHEYALDFAKKVNDMTGGDLRSKCCPQARSCPRSNCSTRSPRERSTAVTACSFITTVRQQRSRSGDLAPATPWTPTCCWPGTSMVAANNCLRSSLRLSAETLSPSPTRRSIRNRSAGSRSRWKKPTTSRD